jgi:predicted metal-dependent HD superfamily phosphohydrolase
MPQPDLVLAQAEAYVRAFFAQHPNPLLLGHDLGHTEQVVAYAHEIGRYYQLSPTDEQGLLVAAWFHDLGYLTGPGQGHEARSADLAGAFLAQQGADDATLARVRGGILATQMPQRPTNLVEQILADADLYQLGTDDFAERNKRLRKEAEELSQTKIGKDDWRRSTIELLEGHRYHTAYCQQKLEAKKQENLARLREKAEEKAEAKAQEKAQKSATPPAPEGPATGPEAGPSPAKAAKLPDGKKTDRGVETVFRVTATNNQNLSALADSKANMMIQVNSILISILLGALLGQIEQNPALKVPAVVLLSVNLATIICAILATRPKIPEGVFTPAEVDQKRVNLLFFGNFYRMSLDDYAAGMVRLINDYEFLYGSLIKDVYFQGIVLGRKYRLLRLAYNVFMFGLIVSVACFVVVIAFFA